jgi:hypothetical protein
MYIKRAGYVVWVVQKFSTTLSMGPDTVHYGDSFALYHSRQPVFQFPF